MRLRFLLVVVTLFVTLAGCGSPDSGDGAGAPESGAGAPSPESGDPQPANVTKSVTTTRRNRKRINDEAVRFENN